MVAADGRVVWFYDQAAVLPDETGRPAFVQGVMLDITARMRVEQALPDSESRRLRVLEDMLRSEEAERARIAGILHDDTIQAMTAALILLDRLQRAAAGGPAERLAGAVVGARSTLAQAVDRTRRITFELRPPLLETQGLGPALGDLVKELGGMQVTLDVRVGRHPFLIEDLAYRTVAEALANAQRHSMATAVRVSLTDCPEYLDGRVTDNGRGFDVEAARDRRSAGLHRGLEAMRERVALTGGQLEVRSTPGCGATVAFRIPLQPAVRPGADP
jgi:signal transduction histidine kinase